MKLYKFTVTKIKLVAADDEEKAQEAFDYYYDDHENIKTEGPICIGTRQELISDIDRRIIDIITDDISGGSHRTISHYYEDTDDSRLNELFED